MNSNPRRNHHILPRLYLKGFCIKDEEPFIWVYKRGQPYNPGNGKITHNPYRESTKLAGVERDFYADPKETGRKDFDAIELELEALEKPSNPIIQKIRAHQSITKEEKRAFSVYTILMHRRVKIGREMIKGLVANLTYVPTEDLFKQTHLPDNADTRAKAEAIVERLKEQPGYDVQAHNRVTATAWDSFLIEVLEKMTWNFYIAQPPHAFLTNDNPVYISKALGLQKNCSELCFPISSDVALVASWNRALKEGFTEAPPQFVKEINRRTIMGADSHIYFCENPDWVVKMLAKGGYDYHPLYSMKGVYTIGKLVTDTPGSKPHVEISI
jgi:hypothetical protein